MRRFMFTIALGALAMTGCGQETEAPNCVRKADAPLNSLRDHVHMDTACEMELGEGLSVAIIPDPEAEGEGCEYLMVVAAPADFALPAMNFSLVYDNQTASGVGFSLRDMFFEDRMSAWYDMRRSFSEASCAETVVDVQEITCRAGYEAGMEAQSCGPVSFTGTEMFAAFTQREPTP